jgi:hypothetical protein
LIFECMPRPPLIRAAHGRPTHTGSRLVTVSLFRGDQVDVVQNCVCHETQHEPEARFHYPLESCMGHASIIPSHPAALWRGASLSQLQLSIFGLLFWICHPERSSAGQWRLALRGRRISFSQTSRPAWRNSLPRTLENPPARHKLLILHHLLSVTNRKNALSPANNAAPRIRSSYVPRGPAVVA